jgi:hypothetical protein
LPWKWFLDGAEVEPMKMFFRSDSVATVNSEDFVHWSTTLLSVGVGILISQLGSLIQNWYFRQHRRLEDSQEASGKHLYDVIVKTPPFPVDGKVSPGSPWQVDILVPSSTSPESFWEQGKPFRKNICFVGQFNAGKTFFISLLANRMYPNSKNVHTDGIAGVYIEERNTMLLDSAGTDAVDCEFRRSRCRPSLRPYREVLWRFDDAYICCICVYNI